MFVSRSFFLSLNGIAKLINRPQLIIFIREKEIVRGGSDIVIPLQTS